MFASHDKHDGTQGSEYWPRKLRSETRHTKEQPAAGKATKGSDKKGSTKKNRKLLSADKTIASSSEAFDSKDDIAKVETSRHRDTSSEPRKRKKVAIPLLEEKRGKKDSESEEHKGQLAALKENDPEFYNYLLETDKELLDFQTGDSDSDEEQDIEASSHGFENCSTGSISWPDCFSPDILQSCNLLQSLGTSSECGRNLYFGVSLCSHPKPVKAEPRSFCADVLLVQYFACMLSRQCNRTSRGDTGKFILLLRLAGGRGRDLAR